MPNLFDGRQGMCVECGKPSSLLTGIDNCKCVVPDAVTFITYKGHEIIIGEIGLQLEKPMTHNRLSYDDEGGACGTAVPDRHREWTDQDIVNMKVINELQRIEDARVWNNAGIVGYLIWLYRKFRWALYNSKLRKKYFNDIGKDFRDDS